MAKFTTRSAIRRQRKKFWKRSILTFLLLGCLFYGSFWLVNLERFNIQEATINGLKVLKNEELIQIIENNISGKYVWLFPKSNFLIYPKNKIKNELLNNFSQIKSVDIKFGVFPNIIINVLEREPFAVWCKEPFTQQCYFMDEDAYIYDEAPNFSGDVYFKYIGNLDGIATTTPTSLILRQTYLSDSKEGQFEKVNLFIRLLRDININGYKLDVKDNNDYNLFFDNESQLIFDGNQDFDEILVNLKATLIDMGDLKGREFEYIDLRFDNKVVSKFKVL